MPDAKDIFLDLIDLPDADREAALAAACGRDDALITRVRALLNAHGRAPEIIVEPTLLTPPTPQGLRSPLGSHASNGMVGGVIDAYTIDRVLGEGGFGTVYEARQEHPVRRTVALKVIRPGMDSRDVIVRFEAERQALAVMDHPSIARVFDAGTTADGRPYFVMERVEGRSITDFADAARLTVRQRIELFEQVCMAVQHAHSKGVIHRDLKPSNIMVASVDGKPFVKIIDFGIAKALDASLVPDAAVTLPTQIIGTPLYMAPEQACPDCPDIDARADVYSLGVVLYELVAGVPPFEPERLRQMRLSEVERIILEEEPPRPSARMRALPAKDQAIHAAARSTEEARLVRALDGDLDWIVMRAIEKDRDRRYGAPLALAAELRRYLRDEPVEAGPPTTSYRLSKFARRHRVEVAAGAIVLVAIIALAIAGSWLAWREHRAAGRAQAQLARATALADFSSGILTGIDPAVARGKDTSLLLDILDGAGNRVDQDLKDEPEAAVSVLNNIGFAFMQVGDVERAERVFRRALTTGRTRLGADSARTMDAAANLGAALTALGRFDEALPLLRGALSARERVLGREHKDTLEALSNLAYLYDRVGNYTDARPVLERLLEVRRRTLGPNDPQTLLTMNNLGNCLDAMGQTKDAVPLFERVLAAQVAAGEEDHPRTMATMNNLASAYRDLGRLDEAAAMHERNLEAKRRVLPPTHPSLLITLVNLGGIYIDLHRYDDAQRVLSEALDRAREGGASTSNQRMGALNALGRMYRLSDRPQEAIPVIEEAIRVATDSLGERHQVMVTLNANLAAARMDAGDAVGAEASARASITLAAETIGASSPATVVSRVVLVRALQAQGRVPEASSVLADLEQDHAAIEDAGENTLAEIRDLRASLTALGAPTP